MTTEPTNMAAARSQCMSRYAALLHSTQEISLQKISF